MTAFEKEQAIEAVKTVIKARWVFVTVAIVQVVLLRTFTLPMFGMPYLFLALLSGICYGYNFLYWLYLKRPVEKISTLGVRIIRVLQVVGDMLVISVMLYLDCTVTIFVAAFFLDVVLIASVIYKQAGILLTSFFTCLLFTVLALVEYYGFFPPLTALYYYSVKENPILLERTLIIFFTCLAGAGALSGYIASLFRKREKRVQIQRDELIQKTNALTQTKNQLKDALVKSEETVVELIKTKENLANTNVELKKNIEELEKFYRVTVGRELKMVELKKKIQELEKKNS